MLPSQNLYPLADIFTEFSLKYFLRFLLHFKQLRINNFINNL